MAQFCVVMSAIEARTIDRSSLPAGTIITADHGPDEHYEDEHGNPRRVPHGQHHLCFEVPDQQAKQLLTALRDEKTEARHHLGSRLPKSVPNSIQQQS